MADPSNPTANLPQIGATNNLCVHELFEEQASRKPDGVAVACGDEALSYAELNAGANRLAHYLRERGVGPEERVGICVERGVEMVVALLGVLKAGGAYVPLDPAYPKERLRFMLDDACASILITQCSLIDKLPPTEARTILLDADRDDISRRSVDELNGLSTPENCAYVIYTSGSTGKPKGVMVRHSSVINLLEAIDCAVYSRHDGRMLRVSLNGPISFDTSVKQLIQMLNGHALYVVPADLRSDAAALLSYLRRNQLNVFDCTPSQLRLLLDAGMLSDSGLALTDVLIGGEMIDQATWDSLRRGDSPIFHNVYGPTECTVNSSISRVQGGGIESNIGFPIANAQIYLLDRCLNPVPAGLPGELHIGGAGLARGYLDRPDLTAEKFIPNLLSDNPGARLYRAGDLGRSLPDGKIEFLGRSDGQVKIRGFRVELGEIEATLTQYPTVRDAIVMLREDEPGDKRLVAYLLQDLTDRNQADLNSESGLSAEHLLQWQTVHNDTYAEIKNLDDLRFNTTGWNSSYTGLPIPEEEMLEYIEGTVNQILALKPSHLMEIGCGSGLLLFRIAPHCAKYFATDFSSVALDLVKGQVKGCGPEYDCVRLWQREAGDFANIEEESFDTVVLNSVIQYFPSLDYLSDVLSGAVNVVKSGGFIFVGDVRSLPLLEAYHASAQLHQARPSLATDELYERTQKGVAQEEELVIAPAFFLTLKEWLPRVSHIEIIPKRGRYHNELTRFRYQVIIHVGERVPASINLNWLDWQSDQLTLSVIRGLLSSEQPEILGIAGIPNARLTLERNVLAQLSNGARPALVSEVFELVRELRDSSLDPEDLWALSDEIPYRVHISWARHGKDGSYDAIFIRRRPDIETAELFKGMIPSPPAGRELSGAMNEHSNNPLRAQATNKFLLQLRTFLQSRLPEYMAPSAFVRLDAWPLTSNGKVNRRALPIPDYRRRLLEGTYLPARTPVEQTLVGIWSEVLGIEQIGINDNFFELGGHSLLATRVLSLVRKSFEVELTLRRLFDAPTVAGLAKGIEQARQEGGGLPSAPIIPVSRNLDLPLSFAQQRLWFLNRLEPDSPVYNIPVCFRLTGRLVLSALADSLNEIVRRHESLRTCFPDVAGKPFQMITSARPLNLHQIDLRELEASDRQDEARRLATQEALRPFNLSQGPIIRVSLMKLGPQEHLLLLILHHIISDDWSMAVLVDELSQLYRSFSTGRSNPLAKLPIQYADFAYWQREYLQGEILEKQLAFWKSQLAGAPALLELPTDRPRPAIQTFNGARQRFRLTQRSSEALKALSRHEGATLFMTLLAAFQTLLARYSGQKDICVGTGIANRNRAEIEGLIGFFVNSLALRIDFKGDPGFTALIRRVKEVALGAYVHQDLPFEQLVAELQPDRNLSHPPLFQVMFMLENAPTRELELEGLKLSPLQIETGTAKFDLIFTIEDRDRELRGAIEYNTDLFDAATIKRLGGHYQNLLEAIIAEPEQIASRVSLLTEEERRQVLEEWNRTAAEYPWNSAISELFEEQAEQRPEAVAVVYEEQELSYRELNHRANQLANHLRGLGVGPETLVGICVERSPEMIVGLLGILKAGGAYLPLDPAYPTERLRFMLEDSDPVALLTQSDLRGLFTDLSDELPVVDMTEPEPLWKAQSGDNLKRGGTGLRAEHLAYVIYTSGSTGRPKGVQVVHQACVNFLTSMGREPGLNPDDRLLAITSLSFDIAGLELYLPLIVGATTVIAGREVAIDGRQLGDALHQSEITMMQATPSTWRMLCDDGWQGKEGLKILCGGEALPRELAARMQGCGDAVYNLYGPTETTIWSTMSRVSASTGPVVIGRPIANTQCYVLDRNLNEVPSGVIGELYLGGEGLARGYLKRAELTAERFVPNPYSRVGGERLYRTGDQAKYRGDGNIKYLGRLDEQIKLRGYRIELGEIEAALREQKAVREAVAMLREDEPGEKRLVGYVVAEEGERIEAMELRRYLQGKLPEYMVPARFVMLDRMPLTSNGKIDRPGLPAPDLTRSDLGTDFIAPRTPVEELLARIWSEVLRLEQVGVRDNFFELGGDSILSIQIIARANEAGLRLTPKHIFQYRTIAELAAVSATPQPAIADQGIVQGLAPLTPIQHWFFKAEPIDPHYYNQTMLLEVEAGLSKKRLEQIAPVLVSQHDALRLRFRPSAAGWEQLNVGIEPNRIFGAVDLCGLSEAEQRGAINALSRQAQASLDLSEGPLLRMLLFESGGESNRLLIVIHCLVVDGVSWRILLEDIQRASEQLRRGEAPQLGRKTTSYQQWARRLSKYAESQELSAQLGYWESQSAGGPLPVDYTTERGLCGSARNVSIRLSVSETQALLQESAQAYRTQINDLLLTALARAYWSWTGDGCLRVELEGHGREDVIEGVDVSRTVGWFTSVYPVRLELGETETGIGAEIKRIKEQLRAIPGRGVGYGLLRYLSEQGMGRLNGNCQVSFNYLGQFDQVLSANSGMRLAAERIGAAQSPRQERRHALSIVGHIVGGQLQVNIGYSEKAHRLQTIKKLALAYEKALRELIEHCRQVRFGGYTPSDFPLARLDQQQLDELLGCDETVEDLYPLSPLQAGMLFHSLHEPGSGAYVVQLSMALEGEMRGKEMERAWQVVMERHGILRSRLLWEGLSEPLQMLRRNVKLEMRQEDWRGISKEAQEQRLREYLKEDRERGFDLGRELLQRLFLVKLGESRYELVWTHHHLLLDGWSAPIVLKEVLSIYQGIREGREVGLERSRPYRDYIEWLRERDKQSPENYWRKELEGIESPIRLAVDRAAEWERGYERAEQQRQLTAELSGELTRVCRLRQVTLNTLMLGAWGLLLGRYSGQKEALYGGVVAGRPWAISGVERMVGPFINTLPVRMNLSEEKKVWEWLKHLQMKQVEMREYEYSSLVEIQGWSEVKRGEALFESILAFENYPVEDLAKIAGEGGLRLIRVSWVSQTNYPLTVVVVPGNEMLIKILYDRTKFDDETIGRMLKHVENLLTEVAVAEPERKVEELSLLGEAERRQLLVEWNKTSVAYPQEKTIQELFEDQVEYTPEAIAVVSEQERLSFEELNLRANQLGQYLRNLGVRPEVLVGIYLDRSVELVVGLLGILKAGGAYLPLDPSSPKSRLSLILADAGVTVLLTQQRLLTELPQHQATVVALDSGWSAIAECSAIRPESHTAPGNTAYVIYTSGSTGQPKGVMIPHKGICNRLLWMQDAFQLTTDDAVLQKTSSGFDVSVWEFFWPLLAGARLVMARPGGQKDGRYLVEVIIEQRITTLHFVPTMLQAFLEESGVERCRELRRVICSGEALGYELQQRFFSRLNAELHNLYGPTEASIDVTFWKCLPESRRKSIPIGRPIANTEIYILDWNLEPAPVGVAGELYIGGCGLARGYLNRSDLTAEKFIPDRFTRNSGGLLYQSGDVARFRSDGNVEYLGRCDDQVKIRGFRIEPKEIEQALNRYSSVKESVVLVREDIPGQKRLVAYVVPLPAQSPTSDELHRFLREQLPDYMIPAASVLLEKLPLNNSGKVDRRALPAPDWNSSRETFVAARTQAENVLSQIWKQALGLERVSVYDRFLELGGDSIIAIQIISKANLAGLKLTTKHLFQFQTIAELAAVAGNVVRAQAEQSAIVGPVVLTPIQLWFFEQNPTEAHHFNQAYMFEIPSSLTISHLEPLVQAILKHHDALRMRYRRADSGWRQINLDNNPNRVVGVADLSDVSVSQQTDEIEAIAESVQRSLDLSAGPLVRVVLVELGSGQPNRLLWVIHHLVVDGVSWRILLDDFELGYDQLAGRRPLRFPPKTTSFQRWAEQLCKYAESAELAHEVDFWLRQHPSEDLPSLLVADEMDYRLDAVDRFRVELGPAETRALTQDLPRVYHTQINDLLLVALVRAFAGWSGVNWLYLALEGHGRESLFDDVDLTRTVGWFTTLFPLMLKLPASDDFGEQIKQIKEQLRAAPGRGIGYGLLRYCCSDLGLRRELEAQPWPPVSFNYLGQLGQALERGGRRLAAESSGRTQGPGGRRAHLLEINGQIRAGRLEVSWGYSRRRHQSEEIERLARGFIKALDELIAHCQEVGFGEYTPSDFPLASLRQGELDQLISETGAIGDLYGLAPLQQGILFHSLEGEKAGHYFEQVALRLRGELDAQALKQAWQVVVAREAVLRSSFHWQGLSESVQIVHEQVTTPWEEEDWRGYPEEEQEKRRERYLAADRAEGFVLSQAPLLRLRLIRLKEKESLLIWSHHHLLLDGWSVALVLERVWLSYLKREKTIERTDSRPYRDYIAWQRQQDMAQAERYWREQLRGVGTAPSLSLGRRSRQSMSGEKGSDEQELRLTPELTGQLQLMARRCQVTLNTVMQGAWGVLLSRYSGQGDVVMGTTVSGRSGGLAGIESMVGLLINTLPLRVRGEGGQRVEEWLTQLQEHLIELRQYEYCPLVKVQSWSESSRGAPLFETLYVFENYPVERTMQNEMERKSGIVVELEKCVESNNFLLALVVELQRGLVVKLMFDPGRCEEAVAARLLNRYQRLLEGMVAGRGQRICELSMMSAAERTQVLVRWNETSVEYPRDRTIQELFEEQVEQRPEAIAVVDGDRELTYRELNLRANRLACHLQQLGVGPEMLVGLCLERSVKMLVGMLGILKAGGAYVPLDANYPLARLSYLLDNGPLPVVVTGTAQLEHLLTYWGQVVDLDTDWSEISCCSAENPVSLVVGENLAYVIYTSGSTGDPKGVSVSHRGVIRLLHGVEYVELGETESILQASPVTFDAATFEIWGALLRGGRCVLLPERVPSAADLGRAIKEQGVTTMWLTASLFNAVIDEKAEMLRGLKQLLVGGEALSTAHIQRALEELRDTQIINGYGPTESTTFACCHRIGRSDVEEHNNISIGRPIANTVSYVMDNCFEPASIEMSGELYLGGDGLARGYLRRADLTAERFIPDTFAKEPGQRLYRTGDMVRYRPDGNLEYLGRMDYQIKLRGHRIEPGEIEAVLTRYPGIKQAIVLAREETPTNKRLVAYLVVDQESSPTTAEIRSHLKQELPGYMIPAELALLDELPLTSHGKVDRQALPGSRPDQSQIDSNYPVPPRQTEEVLAGIWCEVLGLKNIQPDEDFFELGGHSLLATQIMSRVAKVFQVELALRYLFEEPTIIALAARIEEAGWGDITEETNRLLPVSRSASLPLSFSQQRLWFMDQLSPGNPAYNIIVSFKLSGPLDIAVLEASLSELVRRHEPLRTTFKEVNWEPTQVINPPYQVNLPMINLTGLHKIERQIEESRLTHEVGILPFDIKHDPMMRLILVCLASQEHSLIMILHHIAADHWSIGILSHEFEALYKAFLAGGPVTLPELPVQYADYASWQKERLNGEVLDAQLSYWKMQLSELPKRLNLPTKIPRVAGLSSRGAYQSLTLPAELSQSLKRLSRRESASLFMTLLSGFKTLLFRYTGQDDILVGATIANRNRIEIEGLIGFFVNLLALRTRLSGNLTFLELMRRVRDVTLQAYRYQDVPYEELVKELHPDRGRNIQPLFDVIFSLQSEPVVPRQIGDLALSWKLTYTRVAHFDMVFSVVDREQELRVSCEYRSDLFDGDSVRQMLEHYKTILEGVASDPDRTLLAIPLHGNIPIESAPQLLMEDANEAFDFTL